LNVSAYLSIPALTPREVNAPGTSRLVYGAVVDLSPLAALVPNVGPLSSAAAKRLPVPAQIFDLGFLPRLLPRDSVKAAGFVPAETVPTGQR